MVKLHKLILTNFKCYEKHVVHFNETTILIGKNNSGKSTIVEALRLVGLAFARLKVSTVYSRKPDWLINESTAIKGVNISSKAIDIDLECVFFSYNDPPAIIEAIFNNNIKLFIYINSEFEIFAWASFDENILSSRDRLAVAGVPHVCVLPQIVPLLKTEQLVSENTLQRNKFSKRTSRNFRNSLMANKSTPEYEEFQKLIQETWHAIKINELTREENILILQLREKAFATEIYNMGHGVQMWLQTMWFITCAGHNAIIVLDEPDVYMHADLQRKLIRLLKNRHNQTIIATHSVEIMAEVQPTNILIIDRHREESVFADDYPIVQTAISGMGSIHNINLSRLLNTKKYIYVEGNDINILRILYDILYPGDAEPFDHLPSVSTGGWGSWREFKVNAKAIIRDDNDIKVYFLYDRDYHPEELIAERKKDAQDNRIYMHIWSKKEIENFLIVPEAIARVVMYRNEAAVFEHVVDYINVMIDDYCNSIKEDVFDAFIDEAQKTICKNQQFSSIKKKMLPKIQERWSDRNQRIDLVSGKSLLSRLSEDCKKEYDVSFSTQQVASQMAEKEISGEIAKVLDAIRNGKKL